MSDLNAVFLVGRVVSKPSLRYTHSGMQVVTLRIACNDYYKDQEGRPQQKANFFDVVVWGKQAENCSLYLDKGRQVAIMGRLSTREWTTPAGEKRTKVEIIARRVQFIGTASNQQEANISEEPGFVSPPSIEEPPSPPEESNEELSTPDFENPLDDSDIPF